MRKFEIVVAFAAAVVAFATGCPGSGTVRATRSGSDSSGADHGGMGMVATSGTDAEIDSVDVQLDSLVRFGPAHMETIITRHSLTAANMLAGMAADLQRAGVTGDAEWTARVDSVRQDLTRLGGLSEPQLVPFLQGHTQLIHRLTQQYRTLMATAKPAH